MPRVIQKELYSVGPCWGEQWLIKQWRRYLLRAARGDAVTNWPHTQQPVTLLTSKVGGPGWVDLGKGRLHREGGTSCLQHCGHVGPGHGGPCSFPMAGHIVLSLGHGKALLRRSQHHCLPASRPPEWDKPRGWQNRLRQRPSAPHTQ